jgi:hypothetical protein
MSDNAMGAVASAELEHIEQLAIELAGVAGAEIVAAVAF